MDQRLFEEQQRLASLILDNALVASRTISEEPSCKRKGVAAEIWRIIDDRFVYQSLSTNGPLYGNLDCSKCANSKGQIVPGGCAGMHAEQKAIIKLSARIGDIHGAVSPSYLMACSYSPCSTCANHIIYIGGFRAVIYLTLTKHDPRGIQLLEAAGIPCLSSVQLLEFIDQSFSVRWTENSKKVNDVLFTSRE